MTVTTIAQRDPVDVIVIDDLLLDNRSLQERIAHLESDVTIYREIATTAIHKLHDVVLERDRLRAQVREYRHQTREAA
jgi:hypothetical protein